MVSDTDKEPNISPFFWYIESFIELRNDATMNGTIPWTTLHHFATINKIKDFELFRYAIRTIELAFMEKKKDADKK